MKEIIAVLEALAIQFDEMSWEAEREYEFTRRDVWQNAASQTRRRAKDALWIKDAVAEQEPTEQPNGQPTIDNTPKKL